MDVNQMFDVQEAEGHQVVPWAPMDSSRLHHIFCKLSEHNIFRGTIACFGRVENYQVLSGNRYVLVNYMHGSQQVCVLWSDYQLPIDLPGRPLENLEPLDIPSPEIPNA